MKRIEGILGKIELRHSQTEDKTYIAISDVIGNSLLDTAHKFEVLQLKAAFSAKYGSGTFVIRFSQAVFEITRCDDVFIVVFYHCKFPQSTDKAIFTANQADEIIKALSAQ